jgi:tetratricopeptide (TPR) repeat protein
MAVCLGQMGRLDEAVEKLEECLAISPTYSLALQAQPQLRSALRKERTALAWLANAETLVEAGEPIKARQLLDLAPWYVAQDGRLIARRGDLSRLIADRSAAPVSIDDPDADAFAEKMAA